MLDLIEKKEKNLSMYNTLFEIRSIIQKEINQNHNKLNNLKYLVNKLDTSKFEITEGNLFKSAHIVKDVAENYKNEIKELEEKFKLKHKDLCDLQEDENNFLKEHKKYNNIIRNKLKESYIKYLKNDPVLVPEVKVVNNLGIFSYNSQEPLSKHMDILDNVQFLSLDHTITDNSIVFVVHFYYREMAIGNKGKFRSFSDKFKEILWF